MGVERILKVNQSPSTGVMVKLLIEELGDLRSRATCELKFTHLKASFSGSES